MSHEKDRPSTMDLDDIIEQHIGFPKLFFEKEWYFIASIIIFLILSGISWLSYLIFRFVTSDLVNRCPSFDYFYLGLIVIICSFTIITFSLVIKSFTTYIHRNETHRYQRYTLCALQNFCFILSFLLFLFIIIISILIYNITTQHPQWEGTLYYDKLNSTVYIKREDNGLFHIEGTNELDLTFAQGFVVAQNRLWQLEIQRRMGRGILSEVLGKDALDQDKLSRTLGFYKRALQDYQFIPQNVKNLLQSYCDGVNYYISTKSYLSFEFYLFGINPSYYEPVDILIFGKLLSLSLSENYERELIRYSLLRSISIDKVFEIFPNVPRNFPTILNAQQLNLTYLTQDQINAIENRFWNYSGYYKPSINMNDNLKLNNPLANLLKGSFGASNNWVVHGNKTTTGFPILSNDPHLTFSTPSIWNMFHMKTPDWEIFGAGFSGTPGIMLGRNNYISWGVTNVGADVQDIYVMKETNNGKSYYYNNQVVDYQIDQETIYVSGSSPVTIQVKNSVYGPVVNDVFGVVGESVSLQFLSLQPNDTSYLTFYQINRAKNWTEFTQSLDTLIAPSCNFVYADIYGNIGYHTSGKIPIRKEGHSGIFPVVGDGTWDYDGYLISSDLPQVFNPNEGFISSANNRVTPFGYQYFLTHDWEPPFRDERIKEFLNNKEKVSVRDMKDLQMDSKSMLFDTLRPVFLNMKVVNEDWRERMIQWDGFETMDSQEATIFENWFWEMKKMSVTNYTIEFRDPIYLVNSLLGSCDQCMTYAQDTFDNVVNSFNGNVPNWGSVHSTSFPNLIFQGTPLDCLTSRKIPNFGGYETVNVGSGIENTDGPSYRQIIDFSSLKNSLFIYAPGQDGNCFSKNYDNFLIMWRDGQYFTIQDPVTPLYTLEIRKN